MSFESLGFCADKGTRTRCGGLAKQTSLFCCHLNRNAEKSGLWQMCHLLDNSNPIADKLYLKFSDLVTDTDAEPQPVVSGYIEFAGEIVKISSVDDIERVLEHIKTTDMA